MAQSVSRQEADPWAQAKRVYRLLNNKRFNHTQLLEGLYRVAQHNVQREKPPYLVVAVDPVNFEKPYTKKLEGVSIVHKSTPPDLPRSAWKSPPDTWLPSHYSYHCQHPSACHHLCSVVLLHH